MKALIYIANPDMGLSSWKTVTTGYVSDGIAADATVKPYSRLILGPFTAPPDATGHTCLLVAIAADAEAGPAAPLPTAYSSNQVAQRNLEFSATTPLDGCSFGWIFFRCSGSARLVSYPLLVWLLLASSCVERTARRGFCTASLLQPIWHGTFPMDCNRERHLEPRLPR